MKYRKLIVALTLVAVTLAAISSGCLAANALTLARNGKTAYVITVAEDAIAAERTAAAELASYLKKVTGAEFAVRSAAEVSTKTPRIMIGQTNAVRKLLPEVNWKSLGTDGIVIRTKGRNLVIAGGRPRGTLYAVYTFLEKTVGCRWWTSTEEFVPSKRTLTIQAQKTTYVPALTYREGLYRDVTTNPLFAVKLKNNGYYPAITKEFGGHYEYALWGHSFENLMPPQKYFVEHPEWFSLISGKRFAKGHSDWQLCLTNREMRKELAKNTLEVIRQNPGSKRLWVSQNDGYGQCQCDNCQAGYAAAGGAGAGLLLETVNEVAAEVEKQYPDYTIETLCYHWTRKPPTNVRPRHNVTIRLCGLECDFAQPIDSDSNADFAGDIKAWGAITSNFYMYHYASNFMNYVLPNPALFNIGEDIRFFVKSKATGVYVEADNANPIGDMVRMRAWVVSQTLWNPSLDPIKLADEFARGYYGPAGPHISAYVKLAHDAIKRSQMRLSYGNADTSFLTLADMNEATRLWSKAEKAVVNNSELLARVRRDRLPVDLVWIRDWARLKKDSEKTGREFLGPKDVMAASDDYVARVIPLVKPAYTTDPTGSEDANRRYGIDPAQTARQQLELYAEKPPAPPAEAAGLGEGSYRVLHIGEGTTTETVEDLLATDGKAQLFSAQWKRAAFPITADFAGRCRMYVRVRCETKAAPTGNGKAGGYLKPGEAFVVTLMDNFLYPFGRYEVLSRRVLLEEIKGNQYHTIDLGTFEFKPGMFLFIDNGDVTGIEKLYLDRAFLVRE